MKKGWKRVWWEVLYPPILITIWGVGITILSLYLFRLIVG